MMKTGIVLAALILAVQTSAAVAAPKKASNGETCTSSGEKRREGKDAATGEKLDCLWDYCTYCGTRNGKIDCSILQTEFSNPRDCKAVAMSSPGAGAAAPRADEIEPAKTPPKTKKSPAAPRPTKKDRGAGC